MEYILTTNNICKQYKTFKALNGVNIHIPKGSIYGFVGKNGAGKTTLIRLICGLQQPTSGEFSICGISNNSKEIVKSRKRIGAVVETPAICLDMTAKQNLKHQYRILGMPDYNGIEEILEMVGLTDTDKKETRNFSLGMKQRLGIAIALCGNPDFLILDEPINGLDPQGIIEIRELLIKLNKEKQITILISSHVLGELSKLATHYGFIDNGYIQKEISAEELEATCRKCMRVKVSDIKSLILVLDKLNIEYKIISEDEADIYKKITVSELVHALDLENCNVISLNEKDESLENFYMRLIGGDLDD